MNSERRMTKFYLSMTTNVSYIVGKILGKTLPKVIYALVVNIIGTDCIATNIFLALLMN
jgi:hypothetical protein